MPRINSYIGLNSNSTIISNVFDHFRATSVFGMRPETTSVPDMGLLPNQQPIITMIWPLFCSTLKRLPSSSCSIRMVSIYIVLRPCNHVKNSCTLIHTYTGAFSLPTLWIIFLIYFFVACWTYGAGIPSGLFIPCIMIGATYGRFVATVFGYAVICRSVKVVNYIMLPLHANTR